MDIIFDFLLNALSTIIFILMLIGFVIVLLNRKTKISQEYLNWRNAIFTQIKREGFGTDLSEKDQVFGLVCDIGISKDFFISIMSLANGETSLRSSTGGGMINLGANPEYDEVSRRIIKMANQLFEEVKPSNDSARFPALENQVLFNFMTTTGVKQSDIYDAQKLSSDNTNPFAKVFEDIMLIKSMTDEKMRQIHERK